jgi:hypothetical protein
MVMTVSFVNERRAGVQPAPNHPTCAFNVYLHRGSGAFSDCGICGSSSQRNEKMLAIVNVTMWHAWHVVMPKNYIGGATKTCNQFG